MVAIQRPELVRSVITLGANVHPDGILHIDDFDGVVSAEDQEEYNRTSPDATRYLGLKNSEDD
jgi:hypothetical protein